MKERIAKWIFDAKTSCLKLFSAKEFEKGKENIPFAQVNLNEIPCWNDLPEYAKVALQFGIRQGASDGWGAADLTANQKLEGMKSDLEDYQSATFAKAAKKERESVIDTMLGEAESLDDLEMLPKMLLLMKKSFNEIQKAKWNTKLEACKLAEKPATATKLRKNN